MTLVDWIRSVFFRQSRGCDDLPDVDNLKAKVVATEKLKNNAEHKLRKQVEKSPEVRKVSASLRDLRVNNHFAERINYSLRRSNW